MQLRDGHDNAHLRAPNAHQGFAQEGFISALRLCSMCDPSGPILGQKCVLAVKLCRAWM